MAARSLPLRIIRFLCLFLLACVLLTVILVGALRWIDPPTSAFIVRERVSQTFKVRHEWADWDRISSAMKVAVIASEDQTFPDHHGFDLKSIDKALEERDRGRVRGASTISQQVAKNLFLWGGRSWVRKGLEAYFTVLIELLWSKERILEVYLNIAEFGRGVFGVQAASETFFRKSAQRLTRHEAALLAAVLPNPKRLRANAPSRYVRSRQQWILGQMRGLGGSAVLEGLKDR